MHRTISVGTLLHLLFCMLIVAVSCISALIVPKDNSNTKADYNNFDSKYFGENETHNNDKRLIIEDFYRQSALAAKSIQEMSFRLNQSSAQLGIDSNMDRNISTQTSTRNHDNEGKKQQTSEFYNLWEIFIFFRQEKSERVPDGKSLCSFQMKSEFMKWKIYVM